MKTPIFLVLGLVPALLRAGGPSDVLPAAFPASRYEKFAQHSPFSPPTAAAPAFNPAPAPKAPGWADALSISNAIQVGANSFVTIQDRDSNEHFVTSTDPTVTNTRNVTLTSVQWSDPFDQTEATLRRGAEFAVVKFDAVAAKSAPVLQGPPIPGAQQRTASPLNRPVFQPPPGNLNPNPTLPNAVRRNQAIRATPALPVVPRTNAVAPGPGVKLPGADDDDDDE